MFCFFFASFYFLFCFIQFFLVFLLGRQMYLFILIKRVFMNFDWWGLMLAFCFRFCYMRFGFKIGLCMFFLKRSVGLPCEYLVSFIFLVVQFYGLICLTPFGARHMLSCPRRGLLPDRRGPQLLCSLLTLTYLFFLRFSWFWFNSVGMLYGFKFLFIVSLY